MPITSAPSVAATVSPIKPNTRRAWRPAAAARENPACSVLAGVPTARGLIAFGVVATRGPLPLAGVAVGTMVGRVSGPTAPVDPPTVPGVAAGAVPPGPP